MWYNPSKGSGVAFETLERLGFVGKNGIGSALYTLLNPNYMELVEIFSSNQETKEKLTEYYDRYQNGKDRQLRQFEQRLQDVMLALSDGENLNQKEKEYVQANFEHYTTAINSLKAGEVIAKKR